MAQTNSSSFVPADEAEPIVTAPAHTFASGKNAPVPSYDSVPSVKGFVSADEVEPVPASTAPPPKTTSAGQSVTQQVGDTFTRGRFSDDNKKLSGLQFTSQVPHAGDFIGKAIHGPDLTGDTKDDSYYLQDEQGNYKATDKNTQLVFRDPETGEYGVYHRNPAKNYGPITGTLVGLGNVVQEGFNAGAPTRLAGGVEQTLTRGQEALQAARSVEGATGVKVPVPQHLVTESPVARGAAATSQALPGGSGPFDHAVGHMEQGLESARDVAASSATGHVANAENAGAAAREGIENYARTTGPEKGILAKRVSAAYDKAEASIDPEKLNPIENLKKVSAELQAKWSDMGKTTVNPVVEEIKGALKRENGLTYQGIKDLRSHIGEMLEKGSDISNTGMSDKQLRGVYKALTDDMKAAVQAHGGERGLQLWERANTYARLATERREQLGKILGTQRSDEAIFESLARKAGSTSSADAKALATAKKSMPADQWDEIVSGVVGRLGTTKTGDFDSGKFIKDWTNLSDRGKDLLMGSNSRTRRALDNINKLAQYKIPTGHPGPLSHLLGLGLAMGHVGSAGLTGIAHAAAAIIGNRTLASMLSKPATAESVAKWMEGYKVATLKPTKGNVTVLQRLTEGLANDAAEEDRKRIHDAANAFAHAALRATATVSPWGK